MNDLRPTLNYINMRKLAELSGVHYETIKSYKKGKRIYLSDEQYNAVVSSIKEILIFGGIK